MHDPATLATLVGLTAVLAILIVGALCAHVLFQRRRDLIEARERHELEAWGDYPVPLNRGRF